jgi:hypothetical protein
MLSSKPIGWTSLALLSLAVLILAALVILLAIGLLQDVNPEGVLWLIGGLSAVSTVLGFISFRTPQGKIGAIGGLVLLAVVLFVTPVSSSIVSGLRHATAACGWLAFA